VHQPRKSWPPQCRLFIPYLADTFRMADGSESMQRNNTSHSRPMISADVWWKRAS
jgi:hypothetical protein